MNSADVVNKCLNEGIVDFKVPYFEVNEDLSKFILKCLVAGGDKVFLTISMDGNYVLMRKSSRDVRNFFVSHRYYEVRGFKKVNNEGRTVYDCVLNTRQYKTILSKVYKDKANLVHSLFLSLFENGLSLKEYLTGYSQLGVAYSNIVDDIILSVNSLTKSTVDTESKNLFYLWSQSLVAGFSIVENQVKLHMGKSYRSELLEIKMEREEEENIKKILKEGSKPRIIESDESFVSLLDPNYINQAIKCLKEGKYLIASCGGFNVVDTLSENFTYIDEGNIEVFVTGSYNDTSSFVHFTGEVGANVSDWFKWLRRYPNVKRDFSCVKHALNSANNLSNWNPYGRDFAVGLSNGVCTLYWD